MNDKYISVSKFKQSLAKLTVEGGDKKYAEAIARTLSEVVPHLLDDLPAADVQPVKRGEWGKRAYGRLQCSYCGKCEDIATDFCPNCGARMDGDTE